MKPTLSPEFLERFRAVTAKRPKTMIDHMLAHGSITTDELRDRYGYDHAPRAARDVRELGIALNMVMERSADGRRYARYSIDEQGSSGYSKRGGRTAFEKRLKAKLLDIHGPKCFIYSERVTPGELQIDHRIPYEVAGDSNDAHPVPADFMLLCASANRAKSWSCEHCDNWKTLRQVETCRRCYWAFPEDYDHVAMIPQRRLDLIWSGPDVVQYDLAKQAADDAGASLPEFVKKVLRKRTTGED